MAKILGVIWLLLGILWLIKPEMLKNRLKRKIGRRIRWTVYGALIVFGFLMIGSVIKMPGILAKAIGILGVILIIKAVLLMTSKAFDKFWERWANWPLIYFRIPATWIL